MTKASASSRVARGAKQSIKERRKASAGRSKIVPSESIAGQSLVEATMQAARDSGLLSNKDGRIGGRVSAALVEQAKKRTGIQSDTDLIDFALATLALEDHFPEVFRQLRGKSDPDLNIGF